MYCWGSSLNGELGVGAPEVEQIIHPTFMDFAQSWNIKQVACGLTHSLFLTEDGVLYSCGNNEAGQLGHNKITRTPEKVDALENYTLVQVAVGDQHSIAVTSWGLIYAWGENGFGQLGLNSTEPHTQEPKLVKSLAHVRVVQVACGSNHTMALTAGGEVYSWGLNNAGQLGLSNRDSPQRTPSLIKCLVGVPIVHIACGGKHSTALTQAGYVLIWGSNKHGQLGFTPKNDLNYCDTPNLVPNLATYSEPILHVDAGESHTAVIDAHGKIWTFGNGKYGQLGHGTNDDATVPRTVLDLVGSKISDVACGRCHTVIFMPSQGQLYAFGQGLSGQLGIKTPVNRNLPQVVIGPWCSPRGVSLLHNVVEGEVPKVYLKKLYCGGDSSMASVTKELPSNDAMQQLSGSFQPLSIEESQIDQMLSIGGPEDMIEDDLFTYMETAFNSLSSWNKSFLDKSAAKHSHGLDYRQAESCMAKLGRISRESISEVVQNGILQVVKNLHKDYKSFDCLRLYFILPLHQMFSDMSHVEVLQMPFAESILNLQQNMLTMFVMWMRSLPRDYEIRLLNIYKNVVVHIITSGKQVSTEVDRRVLESALKVLRILHLENRKNSKQVVRIPYEEFYIPQISEKIDIRRDYLKFIESRMRPFQSTDNPISFCEYSFLFDAQAKTLLLRSDASFQMQGAIREAVQTTNPLLWFMDPSQVQFLNISIHRDKIVEDTIKQLLFHGITDFKRPLKVHFIGEEAEDAGGVRKEFFLLLLRELLNPDFGMFTQYSETNTIWFKEGALEQASTYDLIGIICGLAIYNFTIINLPFPLALYKKLLGEPIVLDDLAELEPTLTKSLHQLLEYEEDDVENVFCLNFTITRDYFGESQTIPLKPNGEEMPVTSQNKAEYVDLLVDYKLNKSIEKQYQAFHDGFFRVCGSIVLKLFQPMELMALVTGNENYNWSELEQNAEYKGEYHKDHEVIKIFWEIFHDELSLEQKKQFLMFLTGTDRIPILGMKALKMVIQSTSDTNYLPVAHTCVAQLDLPVYNTKEKLRYKLLMAIQQSEGFGLV